MDAWALVWITANEVGKSRGSHFLWFWERLNQDPFSLTINNLPRRMRECILDSTQNKDAPYVGTTTWMNSCSGSSNTGISEDNRNILFLGYSIHFYKISIVTQ